MSPRTRRGRAPDATGAPSSSAGPNDPPPARPRRRQGARPLVRPTQGTWPDVMLPEQLEMRRALSTFGPASNVSAIGVAAGCIVVRPHSRRVQPDASRARADTPRNGSNRVKTGPDCPVARASATPLGTSSNLPERCPVCPSAERGRPAAREREAPVENCAEPTKLAPMCPVSRTVAAVARGPARGSCVSRGSATTDPARVVEDAGGFARSRPTPRRTARRARGGRRPSSARRWRFGRRPGPCRTLAAPRATRLPSLPDSAVGSVTAGVAHGASRLLRRRPRS